MAFWARVLNGVVQEPARELPDDATPQQFFPDTLPGAWETAPDGAPQSGWTYSNGAYAAPVPPTPTLAQQAAATLSAGLTVTSTGTPAINGTYPTTDLPQRYLASEMQFVSTFGTFTTGGTTLDWPDVSGALHEFDIPTFTAFAKQFAMFVAANIRCIDGHATELPSANVTIA